VNDFIPEAFVRVKFDHKDGIYQPGDTISGEITLEMKDGGKIPNDISVSSLMRVPKHGSNKLHTIEFTNPKFAD